MFSVPYSSKITAEEFRLLVFIMFGAASPAFDVATLIFKLCSYFEQYISYDELCWILGRNICVFINYLGTAKNSKTHSLNWDYNLLNHSFQFLH